MSVEKLSDVRKNKRKVAALIGVTLSPLLLTACGGNSEAAPQTPNTTTSASAPETPVVSESASPSSTTEATPQSTEQSSQTIDEAEIIKRMQADSVNDPAPRIASIEIAKNPDFAKQLGASPDWWKANIAIINSTLKIGDEIRQQPNPSDREWEWFSFGKYYLDKAILPLMESGLAMAEANHIKNKGPEVVETITINGQQVTLDMLGDRDIISYPKAMEYRLCYKNIAPEDSSVYSRDNPANSIFSDTALALKKQFYTEHFTIFKDYAKTLDLPC